MAATRTSETAASAIRNFKDDLSIVLVPTGFSAIAAQFMVPQVGEGARIFLFVVSLVAAWKLFDVFGAALWENNQAERRTGKHNELSGLIDFAPTFTVFGTLAYICMMICLLFRSETYVGYCYAVMLVAYGAAHVAVVSVIPINYPNKQEGTKA